ncbi:MAG: PspA/IM30 family protein [Balneolales bacterium]
MFKRFARAIKSLFGGLIGSIEDPKLILEQNIRELNDQVPMMNENIATVKANVMLLQKELDRYEKQIGDLSYKIKSAINADREDIAENYALTLQRAEESAQSTREQLNHSHEAYKKALEVKKAFMREKDRKIQEAREALRASERTAWQGKIADTLEQFEIGGIDSTHDEMINQINQESAKNEARMEMALDSVDSKSMEIEYDAEKLKASELVKQFKENMNKEKSSSDVSSGSDKQKEEKDSAQGEKTIGRKKTKS